MKRDNLETKNRLNLLMNESKEIRTNFNVLQKEYDMTKTELRDTVEKNNSYQNMKSNLNDLQNTEDLENQISELTNHLSAYENAYRNLEEKFKILLQTPVQQTTTPSKQENSIVSNSARYSESEETIKSKEMEVRASISKQKIIESSKKKIEEPAKTPEQNDSIVSELRKRIAEDADAKQTLQEIIRLREDTIKKQKESIDVMNRKLELDKGDIQTSKTQLNNKNSEVKILTGKINEIMRELEKYKKPSKTKHKANNPRYMARQRTEKGKVDKPVKQEKQEKVEKVEAKPYLFGPLIDENELDAFNV